MKMTDLLYSRSMNRWNEPEYKKTNNELKYGLDDRQNHDPRHQTSPSDKQKIVKILTYESSHGFNFSNDIKAQFGFQGIHPKDEFLIKHSRRVSEICVLLGKALGLGAAELKEIKVAGMLHDIGKVYIPDDIIRKSDRLTKENWDIIQTHTILGYELLKGIKDYEEIAKYARSHHERVDGSGYPDGLKGSQIPFGARLIAVVDAYEAMTESRPYRQPMTKMMAIEELKRNAGTQFDKKIVQVFIEEIIKNHL
jgi:putative nucleotidyltransferase with HDIG domain